jgi:hypothetical protein
MLTFTLASEVLLSEAVPETLIRPDTVEPDEGVEIEMYAVEGVRFGGLPPLLPPLAAAVAANARRKNKTRTIGRWRDGCWTDRVRRESMRRSL